MSSEKRQRQRENRMRAVAAAERAKKRSSTTRKVLRVVLAVAAVLIALWLWSVFTGDDSQDSDSDDAAVAADTEADGTTAFETDEPSDEAPPATEAAAEPEADSSPDDTAAPDPTACPAPDGSDGPLNQFDAPPPLCIDPDTMYAAAFDTNMGSFTMLLDPALDIDSVNNFAVLARWGAFDGTLFHRIISDFVIQGGDVQIDFGRGGPGYQFTGAFPPADDWYRIGSVAMANRGNPATNGSQFFVITGPNGAGLPPLYSPLGHVVEGMDVVMEIEGVATGAGDVPVNDVVVRSVTISEADQTQIDAYADARS
ncbi:peptidylprolyl isomerase [Candidatus Poriferisodalis sp.]|uniref:peptidylprolyl isomerase n=1 Tax=Candidatus Poriferisodalis sp. TaxID=3101277 RepID=UPI003B02568A